ncbi:uncharacterized protein [Eurosta solidaginis]|uniref:uncharacterized protein isoform X2 n=1 Tax=Eurosta solidaginis TaxID=178769 RepID=UPI0035311F89
MFSQSDDDFEDSSMGNNGPAAEDKTPELSKPRSFNSASSFLNAYIGSDPDTANNIQFHYTDDTRKTSGEYDDNNLCSSNNQCRADISKQQILSKIGELENSFLELQKQMEAIQYSVHETSQSRLKQT